MVLDSVPEEYLKAVSGNGSSTVGLCSASSSRGGPPYGLAGRANVAW